jgi:hypothetical protein
VNSLSTGGQASFNADMRMRAWPRCLARDEDTGVWCQQRPSHGVLCAPHAWEFQSDEAAKAATRLVRAGFVLKDPSSSRPRRWWAALQLRRARSLRQHLLHSMAGFERSQSADVFLREAFVPERWDEQGR